MGKAKKLKLSKKINSSSLGDQMEEDQFGVTSSNRNKSRENARQSESNPDFVDAKLSKQILVQARSQMKDLQKELEGKNEEFKSPKTVKLNVPDSDDDSDGDSDSDHGGDKEDVGGMEFEKSWHINQKEEEAFNNFLDKDDAAPKRTLADIIMEKITEKKTEIDSQFSESGVKEDLDPRVVEMYKGVGEILKKYRSGKVPKAFKVIAQFRNWEDLVLLTEPDQWSAAAMYQATRVFTSNLKEKMAQRFIHCILLPRIRDDIDTFQRLNFHLYQAISKALFKPGAFFKGFLLPLCESGNCTLREAIIIGSVLAKVSIPVLHSCAVLLKIAEMEYSGANSIFMRIFFDKKYALPYRVVDAVVFHFLRFRTEKRQLPVLWHQAFLTFVQRYKSDISSEQKQALLEILKIHVHHGITPEIRRELQNSKSRDEEMDEPMAEPSM